jgi:CO dehydrogenase maturation factor
MKLAVAGKGGAGKTTFSATASRLLARSGRDVVAIDADTNPNLHAALGVSNKAVQRVPFPPTTLLSRSFNGPALNEPLADVLDRHTLVAPDGVRLLRMGMPEHADEGCLCSAHAVVSALLKDLDAMPDTITLLDMEASPEHLSRGTAREANALVLVAEPYFRSLEAVKLQARLAAETAIGRVVVVANKCRSDNDFAGITEFCANHELDLIARIPWGDEVLDADAATTPLLDFAPDSPVVEAVQNVCHILAPNPLIEQAR